MKKNSTSYVFVVAALIAFAVPVMMMYGQGGGGRRGGAKGGEATPANVPAPTSPVTGNASLGKALFLSYGCYACHGYNGETGARPFVGRWGNLGTEQAFLTFLRGRANVAPVIPSSSMPNFSENTMSDRQAKDIYAYIRTFKSTAVDPKDSPTLSAIIEASKQDKK
jgi:mono/diheme cytochrome c family protein